MTDAQAFGDKVYINAPNVDNDGIECNIAVSFEDMKDLEKKLRACRLLWEGKELLTVVPAMLEHGDLLFGLQVRSAFADMGSVTVHFDTFEKMVLRASREVEIERKVR